MTRLRTIELDAGTSVLIGGARVTLLEKSGRRARVVIAAPEDVKIVHPITTTTTSAHECASLPADKENPHGKHPV